MSTPIQRMIFEGQKTFKRQLAKDTRDSAHRLVDAYGKAISPLGAQIKDLRSIAQEDGMTSKALTNEATLIRLRDATQEALGNLAVVIKREADLLQDHGIRAGRV